METAFMNKILCSTGAVIGSANDRDYRRLTECAKRLVCDGFEFMMYGAWYDEIDEVAAFLKTFPKPVPVLHIEKRVGDLISRNENDDTKQAIQFFEKNCILAEKIEAEKLVLHLWGGRDSDKDFAHNIEVYPVVNEIASRHNLTLTIENVVCNRQNPMSHLLTLAELYPDIRFTFDTKMAAFHSQIEELYSKEHRWLFEHMAHMHINDYKGGHMDWQNLRTLHIGDGKIDFDRFFEFVNGMGYAGDFTIESTSLDKNGVIDFEKLNHSIYKLKEYINR